MKPWIWTAIFIVMFWIGWGIAANFPTAKIQLLGRTLMFLSVIVISGIIIHQINHPKKSNHEQRND